MPTETPHVNLDLANPRFKADPYPTYARLRTDSPVAPTRLPDGREAWLVSRYEDAALGLKDARFAKDRRRVSTPHRLPIEGLIAPLIGPLQFNMLRVDPPDHPRPRALGHKALAPRLFARLG